MALFDILVLLAIVYAVYTGVAKSFGKKVIGQVSAATIAKYNVTLFESQQPVKVQPKTGRSVVQYSTTTGGWLVIEVDDDLVHNSILFTAVLMHLVAGRSVPDSSRYKCYRNQSMLLS